MTKLLLRGSAFVAITIPLTWLWIEWGREAYRPVLVQVAEPMLAWFGAPQSQLGRLPQRFISYVPFTALIAVTPRLSLERRLGSLLLGYFLLFLSHAGFILASIAAYTVYGETPRAIRAVFPVMLLVDAFPFVLWAIFAWDVLRDAVSRASERVFGGSGGADR